MPQNMKKVHKCQIFKCIEDIMMNDANRMHARHKRGFNLVNKIFIFIEKVPERLSSSILKKGKHWNFLK